MAEDAVMIGLVSSLQIQKCRVILTKCREALIPTRLKAIGSQSFRWHSPYSQEQGGDHF